MLHVAEGPDLDWPVTNANFINLKANDSHFNEIASLLGMPGSVYFYYRNGIFFQHSKVDGAVQEVYPPYFVLQILHLSYYPVLAGHPREKHFYDTLGKDFYWPHMTNDKYTTVSYFLSSAAQGTWLRHQMKLRLLLPSSPLEFIAIHIIGPLRKTSSGSQYVLVFTNWT